MPRCIPPSTRPLWQRARARMTLTGPPDGGPPPRTWLSRMLTRQHPRGGEAVVYVDTLIRVCLVNLAYSCTRERSPLQLLPCAPEGDHEILEPRALWLVRAPPNGQ